MTPKVLVFYLVIAFLGSVVFSCGSSGGGSPSEVVSLFLDEMAAEDLEGAKKYCTTRTAAMIDMAKAMQIAMGGSKDPDGPKREDILIQSESIEGETAVVLVLNKVNNNTQPYDLILEDGRWKINQESLK